MSTQNKRAEKIKMIFAQHPTQKVLFLTSDDRAFFDENRANGYAQTLKDKAVTKHLRPVEEVKEKVIAKIKANQAVTEPDPEDPEKKTTQELEEPEAGEGNQNLSAEGAKIAEGSGDQSGADDDTQKAEPSRAELATRYEELLGKKPTNFMNAATIAAKIAEAEASLSNGGE